MSMSNSGETNVLKLLLQNVTWANIGDATGLVGSGTAGSWYVSLHTSDPGEAGTQTTNEAAYTSYARVAVARSTGGWAVTNDTGDNVAAVTFPQATGGSETETHFGVGRASSGTGELVFSGALTSSLAVSVNITPEFAAGALDIVCA